MALPIIGVLLGIGEKLIDKLMPDPSKAAEAKIKLAELAQQGALAELKAETDLLLAQSAVNLEEAKSPSLFKSGWRPAAGWVCVCGMSYAFLLHPILSWISLNFGILAPPSIEMGVLTSVLMGMLGLAGIRGYEKKEGVAAK